MVNLDSDSGSNPISDPGSNTGSDPGIILSLSRFRDRHEILCLKFQRLWIPFLKF